MRGGVPGSVGDPGEEVGEGAGAVVRRGAGTGGVPSLVVMRASSTLPAPDVSPDGCQETLDVKRLDIKRLHVDTTTTLIVMEDEVDRLVAAWRRERPDLDVEPLEVLSRVSRLARHLDRARRLAFAEHSLEPWEFDVLTALRRAGSPVPALPRPAADPDPGHLRHDDEPYRPAGEEGPGRAPPRPQRPPGRTGPPHRGGPGPRGPGLLAQEPDSSNWQERPAILAELSSGPQRGELQQAGLLRQLTAPFDNIPG
jgi:hypothetical protein